MSDQLFNVPESLSPRLAWLKKHGVRLHHNPSEFPDDPWCVWLPENEQVETPGIPAREDLCGFGATEEDALCELAKIHNLKLWNEEEAQ